MPEFEIEGPFEVPWQSRGHGRVVDVGSIASFWNELPEGLAARRGCYVFGMRAGRGIVPIYVGKATRTFRQECFALHKLYKINSSLLLWRRGTPILYFVPVEQRRGRVNAKLIATAEQFLIQNAVARNPDLANIRGTAEEAWAIAGVLRNGRGKPSRKAQTFKKMMGLQKTKT